MSDNKKVVFISGAELLGQGGDALIDKALDELGVRDNEAVAKAAPGQQNGGFSQQLGRGGQQQPGQKPVKQPKPLGERENVNAGVMLPSADDFDPNMDVSGFTGLVDVTPHVAGGAIQIVGGVRPPEDDGSDDAGGDDAGNSAPTPPKNPAKSGAKTADSEGGLSDAVQQVYGKELKGGKREVKPKGKK